jgi:hypothetical protein
MDNSPGESSRGVTNVAFYPFFPRREASFPCKVQFYETGKLEPAGRFDIANPVGTRHPTWSPESLPVTRRSGPLEVTLTEATWGWSYMARTRPARGAEAVLVRLRYRLPARSRDWRFVGVTLSDATGGSYRFGTDGWQRAPGTAYIRGDNVCREEGAYEYRLEFSQAESPGVRPAQSYDLGPYTLGDLSRPVVRFLPDGRRVTLFSEAAEGTLFGNWSPRYGQIGRLRATDVRGRPLKTIGEVALPGGIPHGQQLGMSVPKGTRQVRLRFEVYQSRYVTFRIKPRWITPLP